MVSASTFRREIRGPLSWVLPFYQEVTGFPLLKVETNARLSSELPVLEGNQIDLVLLRDQKKCKIARQILAIKSCKLDKLSLSA